MNLRLEFIDGVPRITFNGYTIELYGVGDWIRENPEKLMLTICSPDTNPDEEGMK